MKKLFALILLTALLLTGCGFRVAMDAAQEVLETAPEMVRVETLYPMLYTVTVEYPDGDSEKKSYDYAPNRAPLSLTYYRDGEKIGTEVYACDDHNSILSITPDWEGGQVQTFQFTYGENGEILTEEAWLDGVPNYTAVYTYDGMGHLLAKEIRADSIQRLEYDLDEEYRVVETRNYLNERLLSRTVDSYNEAGKYSQRLTYDESGKLIHREEYTFEPKASRETVLIYAEDGALTRKYINYYDTYDSLLRQEAYTPEEALLFTTYYHIVHSRDIQYIEVPEATE